MKAKGEAILGSDARHGFTGAILERMLTAQKSCRQHTMPGVRLLRS